MLLLAFAFVPGTAFAAKARTPTLAPSNTVIDGPTADIVGLSGMTVARDGTGAVVYVKNLQGTPHVFVSRLLGGHFRAPQQVDAGLPAASSQPVIAAANPGQVVVAFINAGSLYAVQATGTQSPFTAPLPIAGAASNPALSMSTLGKAYLAFTQSGSGGGAVQVAYYNQGVWALVAAPLNADPSADAGTGGGRPAVIAAGDGVGIVAWGEGGHIYTRRVWGTSPSVVFQQADPSSVGGVPEVSAREPAIGSGGDSSYAAVAFRETIGSGANRQSRVLMNRLHGGGYDGIAEVDGALPFGGEGADQPRVAVTEFGRGFITSETDQSHNIIAAPLSTNAAPTITERLNSQIMGAAPDAVPAVAGTVSTMVAWQQQPGLTGQPEIRLRYAPDGANFNPELVVSSASLGPTNADSGLAAGGDLSGDAVVSWIQGTGPGTQIVAGQLYQTPGGFVPETTFRYANSANPILDWSTSSELWGGAQYVLRVDGVQVASTILTTIRSPVPVANGRHSWQVTAVNQAGLSTVAAPATVFVDTVRPKVSFTLKGSRTIGTSLRIDVKATDTPPGVTRSVASGIKSVQVKWGDGPRNNRFLKHSRATHTYKRRRAYVVTVIVKDRAGNKTVVTRRIRITKTGGNSKKAKTKPKHSVRRRQTAAATFSSTTPAGRLAKASRR